MKFSPFKFLFVLTVVSSLTVGGMAVYQLLFSFKSQSTYGWSMKALDQQTIRFQCDKITLYFRSHQNPQTAMPVSYSQEAADNQLCASKPSLTSRFPYLTSPDRQCQPVDAYTWRCQNDMVKAIWKEQQASVK